MRRVLALAVLGLLAAAPAAGARPVLFPRKLLVRPAHVPVRAVPGVLLVTYRPGGQGQRARLARAVHARQLAWYPALRVQRLHAPRGAAARLRRSRAVANVGRDVLAEPLHTSCVNNPACEIPNDPDFPKQWWLQSDAATTEPDAAALFGADVDAPLAWRFASGSTAVVVAVVDSGVDLSHPDIGPRVVSSATLAGNGGNLTDNVGHGTAVAGVIAAIPNNGVGVAGVAWNASIMNVKVQSDSGPDGSLTCSAAANGIMYAAQHGANIINLSFGSPAPCSMEESAVDAATQAGALVVAAAGNDADNAPHYPAAYANVLSVAATDDADHLASFSSWGASWVDVAAPGVRIWTTLPVAGSDLGPGSYGYVDGTSFSTPIVAGIAALIWPTTPDANGDGHRNDDVAARIEATAEPIVGTGTDWRYGRVDACLAAAPTAAQCAPGAPPPASTAAPVTTPTPVATVTPAPLPAPKLTVSTGHTHAQLALAALLGNQYRQRRHAAEKCRLSGAAVACTVAWTTKTYSYWGTVTVRVGPGAWHTNSAIKRVALSCAVRHGRTHCKAKRYAKKT